MEDAKNLVSMVVNVLMLGLFACFVTQVIRATRESIKADRAVQDRMRRLNQADEKAAEDGDEWKRAD